MKNIAIITHSLNSGGAERVAGLLSKMLDKSYKVYLFCGETSNIVYTYGGELVDFGRYAEHKGISLIYALRELKLKLSIDVAISFLPIMNTMNILSVNKERVIISERNVPSRENCKDICSFLYPYADYIVACAEGVKHDLTKCYGLSDKWIGTIYNFIDKKKIVELSKEKWDEEISRFVGNSEWFINVGRLDKQKNQLELIRQFALFHEADKNNIKLLIIGSGEEEAKLSGEVEKSSLGEFVKILPYVNNPFRYIRGAKALVFPSVYEGLPNVVLESMVLGCPVIAADCLSGPRELLDDDKVYGNELQEMRIAKRGLLIPIEEGLYSTGKYIFEAMKWICTHEEEKKRFIRNELKYMDIWSNGKILDSWIEVIEDNSLNVTRTSDFVKCQKIMLDEARHIWIYGAGRVGKRRYIELSKKYKIEGFIVSDINQGRRMTDDLSGVYSLDDVDLKKEKTVVVIGVGLRYCDEVIRGLKKRGFSNIYII